MSKKEFEKAEIEVIRFEKIDIISSSTQITIEGGGQNAVNGPVNPPPIPFP